MMDYTDHFRTHPEPSIREPKKRRRQMLRGDNIPPISDYAHWNEEAEQMWYLENRYDMEHWDEPVDDGPDDWEEDLDEEENEDE